MNSDHYNAAIYESQQHRQPSEIVPRWDIYNAVADGTYKEKTEKILERHREGILDGWTNYNKKEYNAHRERLLPSVLFAGTFSRAKDTVPSPSEMAGVINLDLDEDPKAVLDYFAENNVSDIPFVEACGKSVSGQLSGARWANVLIEIPASFEELPDQLQKRLEHSKDWLSKLYHLYHDALSALFADYGIHVAGAKDYKRLRLIADDDELYTNREAERFSLSQLFDHLNATNPNEQLKQSQRYTGGRSAEAIMNSVIERMGEPKPGARHHHFVSFFFICLHHGIPKHEAVNFAAQYGGDYEAIADNIYSGYAHQAGACVGGNGYKHTDVGNAQRFGDEWQDAIRYCPALGGWLVWDGKRWKRDDLNLIQEYAKQTAKRIQDEANSVSDDKTRNAILGWAKQSQGSSRLSAMLRLASSDERIARTDDAFDDEGDTSNVYKLNLANGTYDLLTNELYPHSPDNQITKLSEVTYDQAGRCGLWEDFLNRIFAGDSELIRFIQKAVGYSLSADTGEQVVFILYGSGANGKSTFIETCKALLGEYSTTMPMESLLAKSNPSSNTNDLARLRSVRFLSAAEADEGRSLSESKVKLLTGGDTISARFLYGEYFEFKPTHKIFLATNHKPNMGGTDDAIWRRIRLIPFSVTIPPEERDPELQAKLKHELPGILNWAIEGFNKWRQEGLGEPVAVKEATSEYRAAMDVIAHFISDCCDVDPDASESAQQLYDAYTEWCDQTGEKPLNQRGFGEKLSEKGFEKKRKNKGRRWVGLSINPWSRVARSQTQPDSNHDTVPAHTGDG